MLNFKNKTMIKIEAKIIADSINPQGDRLTSVLVTFPRIILAEVNTHRMLSKNTSSSRAVPFEKMVESIQNDPFIPIAFQKHHSGMQGTEYITDEKIIDFKKGVWVNSRNKAIQSAEELYYNVSKATSISDVIELEGTGVTKQLCNRLLEPFMWTTMLITGSKEGWDNFFSLRLPEYHLKGIPTVDEALSLSSETITLVGKSKKELLKEINQIDNDSYTGFKTIINNYTDLDWLQINKGQAEIHMMALAEEIYDAMNESTPEKLEPGDWHIPFSDTFDMGHFADTQNGIDWLKMVKVSTAMAARTSYTVIEDEKEIDYERMIELHDKLIELKHLSPLEHCARAMTEDEYHQNIKGHVDTVQKTVNWKDYFPSKESLGWCRNFKGFIPYRHIIETQK